MTDRKIQTTLVIRGDSRDSVRALNLTEKELDKLIGKQNQGAGVAQKLAANYGKVVGQLNTYAKIAGGVAVASTTLLIRNQLQQIDTLAKTSDKLGIATDKLVGLRHAAELTGVSQDKLDVALQRMVRRLADAAEGGGPAATALEELGLSAEELIKLSPDQAFSKIADEMQGVEDQSRKVSIAFKLFDSEGVGLVNTLALGSDGLRELQEQADLAGVALSRVEANKIEQANDAITQSKLLFKGFAQQVTVQAAPVISDLAGRIFNVAEETDGVASTADKAFGYVIHGVGVMADGIHGVRIVVKGLETAFAGVANVAIQGFGLIVEGYTNLADLIPGIDIDYGETAFGRLEATVARNFATTRTELQELLMKEIPSTALENYVAGVQRSATEAAEEAVGSQRGLIDAGDDLLDQLDETEDAADDLKDGIRDLSDEAGPLGDSFGSVLGEIDRELSQVWRNGEINFRSMADGISAGFGDLLADLVHQSTTKPILASVGFNVGGGSGASINIGGGGSGSGSNPLASFLGLGGGVPGIANLLSDASFYSGNVLSSIGLDGLADSAYGRAFDATTFSATDAFKDIGLSVAAGYAGNYVGGELGGALTGKVAESNIGSQVLGTIGSFIGGPLGSFVGSTIGATLDAVFGGDGKKDVKAGFLVNPAANTANNFAVSPFASGYDPIGFAERVDRSVANQVIDIFRSGDFLFNEISKAAGIDVNFKGKDFNGLDAKATPGSSGLFFGLSGENGLGDQDLGSQVANFLLQEINAVADQLDPEVLEAVNAAGMDAEAILKAYAEALDISSAASEEQAEQEREAAEAADLLAQRQQNLVDRYIPLIGATERYQQELETLEGLQDQLSESEYQEALQGVERAYAEATGEAEKLRKAEEKLRRAREDQLDAVEDLADELASRLDDIRSLSDKIAEDLGIDSPATTELERIERLRDQYVEEAKERFDLEKELHNQQVENYREQLELSRDIGIFSRSLLTGDLSPLDGAEKLDIAKEDFYDLATKAAAGDTEAGKRLTGVASNYLQLARDEYASSPEYTRIFEAVRSRLGTVQGVLTEASDPGEYVQETNDILREKLEDLRSELQDLEGVAQAQIAGELIKLNIAVGDLPEELADLLATVFSEEFVKAFNAGIAIANNPESGSETGGGSGSATLTDVSGFLAGVVNSGADFEDQVTAVVNTAKANGVTPEEIADAYSTTFGTPVTGDEIEAIASSYGQSFSASTQAEPVVSVSEGPSQSDISSYLNDVVNSGAAFEDQVRDVVTNAIANDVSSDQVADAYSASFGKTVSGDEIRQIAAAYGLPMFAEGGIATGPSIIGEAGLEAAVPLKHGAIPVDIRDRGQAALINTINELGAAWRGVETRLELIESAVRISGEVVSSAVQGNAESVVSAIETESAIGSRRVSVGN